MVASHLVLVLDLDQILVWMDVGGKLLGPEGKCSGGIEIASERVRMLTVQASCAQCHGSGQPLPASKQTFLKGSFCGVGC